MRPPRDVKSWNEYFIKMAFVIAERSKDPSTQHGSVIVDEKNCVVSTGFNGGSREIPDELVDWQRPQKYAWIIHSEENALWMANRRNLNGCTLYVTGKPCSACMLRISHAGIKKIIFSCQESVCVDEENWLLSQKIASMSKIELIDYGKL